MTPEPMRRSRYHCCLNGLVNILFELKVKSSENDYKGGVAGGGGSQTDMGAMEISAQDVEERIQAAHDRKDELKNMSQSELKAAFASGDPVRMASLVQRACGWLSRGKHTAAHNIYITAWA